MKLYNLVIVFDLSKWPLAIKMGMKGPEYCVILDQTSRDKSGLLSLSKVEVNGKGRLGICVPSTCI